jgi:predicted Zn-dependent protease with MMP-like domain
MAPPEIDEARTIVLYRKNLARAVASRDELVAQVRTTLLHEIGHLRGEDDEALRARGLE